MFTIEQIKAEHSKVKSGADFPAYIQELIKLGLTGYDNYVCDGTAKFFGKDNFEIQSQPKYTLLQIADKSNSEKFTTYLKSHQAGETDYPTFCKHSAETGVEKWTVDMHEMSCTYYDKAGNKMLVETIPQPK